MASIVGLQAQVIKNIADLGWESLAERRAKAKAAMTYKIMNGLVDVPKTKFIESTCNNTRSQAQFLLP